MRTVPNLLSTQEIHDLLAYHALDDERTDARPDVRSKHPRWNEGHWPQAILEKALHQTLGDDFTVEEIIFATTKISFQLHADSGDGSPEACHKALLIPLQTNGPSTTVFFNNHWFGPSAKFTRESRSVFFYQLPGRDGQLIDVPDLRVLRQQCLENPEMLKQDFIVNAEFLATLDDLILARENGKISKVDPRISDYSKITGYAANRDFDPEIQQRWLPHLSLATLQGLEVDQVVTWNPGEGIVFDRSQLHAGGVGHTDKTSVVIFTRKAP